MIDFHPLVVLIDELKSSDQKRRCKTVKTLPTFAIALGPLKTRKFLVPFIYDLFQDEDQDVVMTVIQTVPTLLNYLGGA